MFITQIYVAAKYYWDKNCYQSTFEKNMLLLC